MRLHADAGARAFVGPSDTDGRYQDRTDQIARKAQKNDRTHCQGLYRAAGVAVDFHGPDGRAGRGPACRRHRSHRQRDTALAEGAIGGDQAHRRAAAWRSKTSALKLLALRQPMAIDLRETLAAIKIASELERIGDLAKNIAKRAHRAQPRAADPPDAEPRAHGPPDAEPAQARARRLFRSRCRGRRQRLAPRRRDRRDLQQPVPRASHLHDGRPAHDRHVHASALRGQEHRAHRRPCHQHRRGRVPHGPRRAASAPTVPKADVTSDHQRPLRNQT